MDHFPHLDFADPKNILIILGLKSWTHKTVERKLLDSIYNFKNSERNGKKDPQD